MTHPRRHAATPDPEALRRFLARARISAAELELLRQVPLFARLAPADLIAAIGDASARRFARGEVLFLQGEPATRFYVVLDGWVRLYRETVEGQESMIAVFTRGDSFAEAAIFEERAFPVNASAVNDARLLVIPAGPFLARLRASNELCFNMMASMSIHLRRLVQQIEHLKLRSSVERVADFLLKLNPGDAEPAVIELPWDKSLVASRLGMQPETFSRSLAKLRRLGVESQRNRIVINDVAALRQLSGGTQP